MVRQSPWVSKAESRPLLTADSPTQRVTVTFQPESLRSPSWSSLIAYTGSQQTAERLCMLPRDSGPRFGPDEAANLQVMMPVLIKHGLLHRWPE